MNDEFDHSVLYRIYSGEGEPSEERIREIDEGIVPRKSSGSAKSARRNKMCLEYDKGCERGCICDVLNC